MKQYTSHGQTAKLIELGFAPIGRIKEVRTVHSKVEVSHDCNFTIGELIEMLLHKPFCSVSIHNVGLRQHKVQFKKLIKGKFKVLFREIGCEPINLLFNCIVKLKEEGVI